jgi:quercetin dioxygenase-like cupin family protein
MRRTESVFAFLVALGVTLFAGAALAEEAKPMTAAAKAPQLWAASDIKWVPDEKEEGAWQAVLWGDPKKSAYGALGKWSAGKSVPLHSHTRDIRGVMIAGTFVIGVEGMAKKELPSGSYLSLPGGVQHTTECKAGADCVFFSEQDGPFDLVPAATAAMPKK